MSKVVFFDMDGTLLAQKDPTSIPCMSEYTKEILKEVRKQGHHLFIASGRPYAFLPEEVLEGYFDGFVLANGACIIYQQKDLYFQPLDKNKVKKIGFFSFFIYSKPVFCVMICSNKLMED